MFCWRLPAAEHSGEASDRHLCERLRGWDGNIGLVGADEVCPSGNAAQGKQAIANLGGQVRNPVEEDLMLRRLFVYLSLFLCGVARDVRAEELDAACLLARHLVIEPRIPGIEVEWAADPKALARVGARFWICRP